MKALHSDTRLLLLGVAIAIAGFAVIGMVVAQQREDRRSLVPSHTEVPLASKIAPSYRELREGRRGPNAGLYTYLTSQLQAPLPDPEADVPAGDREQARRERQARRAYAGAPPTVPHAVMQQGSDCVACHLHGAVIAGKVAPKMSHDMLPSCTQCHVPSQAPAPAVAPPTPFANDFVGLQGASRGTRAWPGAPPTIPHPTNMREDCNSCHGVTGKSALRTPHPMQTSCTQCHVPQRAADQRPVVPTRLP